MSGQADGLEAVLAEALHAQIDGDFLVAASRWEKGADVALSTASATEVVWWAVNAVAPVVRAHLAETLDAVNDERLRLAIENAGLRDDLDAAREDVARAIEADLRAKASGNYATDAQTDEPFRNFVTLAEVEQAIAARLTPTDGAP